MVWSCITWEGVGFITKIDTTMDKHLYLDILKEDLVNTIKDFKMYPKEIIFQQDNDLKHKANLVSDWLDLQPFDVMVWPPQSPDLNPIENIWALLKQRLFEKPVPSSMHEHWVKVSSTWYDIDKAMVRRYIETMPERCRTVIKANGRWTKY
jgi:hypothetical protein